MISGLNKESRKRENLNWTKLVSYIFHNYKYNILLFEVGDSLMRKKLDRKVGLLQRHNVESPYFQFSFESFNISCCVDFQRQSVIQFGTSVTETQLTSFRPSLKSLTKLHFMSCSVTATSTYFVKDIPWFLFHNYFVHW